MRTAYDGQSGQLNLAYPLFIGYSDSVNTPVQKQWKLLGGHERTT
jgi:hypothetical protein